MLLSAAVRNLLARRARTILTALGIGTSVALIVSVFTVATNVDSELAGSLEIIDADLVAVQRGLAGPVGGTIPETCVTEIESCDGVRKAAGLLMVTLNVGEVKSFNLFGICPEDRSIYASEGNLREGRQLQEAGEIELGRVAAEALHLGPGDTLEMETGEKLAVTGIYQTGYAYLDNGGLTSLEDTQNITGRTGKVGMVTILLEPDAEEGMVTASIEGQFRYLEVISVGSILGSSEQLQVVSTLAKVLYAVAGLLGCIGVTNAMSLSVSERTREIGILRALGWSRSKVTKLVLSEALMLSGAGFALGSLLGIVILWAVSAAVDTPVLGSSLDGHAFLVGFLAAVGLGLVGGAIPAYRASRLSPLEAMRHE